MPRNTGAMPAPSLNAGSFVPTRKMMLIASVIALLPSIALAMPPQDIGTGAVPARQMVEQRVLDQPARILQQMKGSVCGTGPVYAGKVDDPVFVTPLFNPTCAITPRPPVPRRDGP